MSPFPFCILIVAIFHAQSAEAATTYNLPLIQQTLEVMGKDAVKEVTSMINSGTFSLSSLNLTDTSNLTSSAALQYLKDTVDEDYAKAVAYAIVNVAAQKAFKALGSLDFFD